MEKLLEKLKSQLPGVIFEQGEAFFWSPEQSKITYNFTSPEKAQQIWALLHEASHAFLQHKTYQRDVQLLLLEVAAWQRAKSLAKELDITIDEDHIQDCLDTYRDWLHQRATCPRCGAVSLQVTSSEYGCHNCAATWHVSASRFCRPYRLSNTSNKKSLEVIPQPTFQ